MPPEPNMMRVIHCIWSILLMYEDVKKTIIV